MDNKKIKAGISKDEPEGIEGLLPAALRGLLAGIILAAILALILSGVAVSMDDPSKLLEVFALASLFIGAFADGLFAAKAFPDGGLAAGVLGGALYVLLMWLVSLFLRGGATNAASPLMMALGYAGCIAVSALGGLLGRPRTKHWGDGKMSPAAKARKRFRNNS